MNFFALLLSWLGFGAVCFVIGYYVAQHPGDTRSFFEKVRAALGRALQRGE